MTHDISWSQQLRIIVFNSCHDNCRGSARHSLSTVKKGYFFHSFILRSTSHSSLVTLTPKNVSPLCVSNHIRLDVHCPKRFFLSVKTSSQIADWSDCPTRQLPIRLSERFSTHTAEIPWSVFPLIFATWRDRALDMLIFTGLLCPRDHVPAHPFLPFSNVRTVCIARPRYLLEKSMLSMSVFFASKIMFWSVSFWPFSLDHFQSCFFLRLAPLCLFCVCAPSSILREKTFQFVQQIVLFTSVRERVRDIQEAWVSRIVSTVRDGVALREARWRKEWSSQARSEGVLHPISGRPGGAPPQHRAWRWSMRPLLDEPGVLHSFFLIGESEGARQRRGEAHWLWRSDGMGTSRRAAMLWTSRSARCECQWPNVDADRGRTVMPRMISRYRWTSPPHTSANRKTVGTACG